MVSPPAPGGGGEREAMVSSVPITGSPAKGAWRHERDHRGTAQCRRLGVDRDGREQQVHPYQGGPYTLSDVAQLFDLGRLEESRRGHETVLVLTAEEVRTLRTMADAYSFDYEEEFIEMCLEMALFADQLVGGQGGGEVRFTANF